MKIIIFFFMICRPFISFVSGLIAVSTYLGTSSNFSIFLGINIFLFVFLTSAYGFVLNDIFDLNKDTIDHKDRILVKNLISKKTAQVFSFLLFLVSVVISIFSSLNLFALNIVTLFLLTVYSPINNKNGIIANLITALLCSFVILVGVIANQVYKPNIISLAIATFFFFIAREIILDIRDIKGDKVIKKISVPLWLGVNKAIIVCFILLLIFTAFIIRMSFTEDRLFLYFVVISFNLIIWISFLNFAFQRTRVSLKKFLLITRVAFLLVIPYVLLT